LGNFDGDLGEELSWLGGLLGYRTDILIARPYYQHYPKKSDKCLGRALSLCRKVLIELLIF